MENMLKKQQNIRVSGANGSNQKVADKGAIKTVVTMTRTILMYAVLRCSDDTVSNDLWPMKMYYAVWA